MFYGVRESLSEIRSGLLNFEDTVLTSIDRFFAAVRDPLMKGDLLAYAKEEYPPEEYPTAWVEIPDDLRQSLVWHGKLLNGRDVAELAKVHVTADVVKTAIRRAAWRALFLTIAVGILFSFIAGGMASLFTAIFNIAHPLDAILSIVQDNQSAQLRADMSPTFWNLFMRSGYTPYPQWAADAGAWWPVFCWYALSVLLHVHILLTTGLVHCLPAILMFLVFWFFGFAALMTSFWESISWPLRIMTRDAALYHRSNGALFATQYDAYCRAVETSIGRNKDQPFLALGKATGLMRERGDMQAPERNQIVGVDGETLREHVIGFGDTGTGKTRDFLKPFFQWIMTASWGEGHKIGAYVTDGKGTLYKDLAPLIANRKDVRTVGTEADHYGVDLTKGMSPTEINSTFKAIAGQLAGGASSGDSFWPTSAGILLMHAAMVCRALELDTDTMAMWKLHRGFTPYSLLGISLLATNDLESAAAVSHLAKLGKTLDGKLTDDGPRLYKKGVESAQWFVGTYLEWPKETRSGVAANVNVVLGHLRATDDIAERFCSGTFERVVDVDYALKGGIILNAVGESEHGTAGKVVNLWLKTRLYVMAQRRLKTDPEDCKNVTCAMFADELQMLATIGENSDATTWNWSRQAGLLLVAATQSVAALKQAMGEDATDNLLTLLRTKIILKTSEFSTIEYARKSSGEDHRGPSYANLYSTYAERKRAVGDVGNNYMRLGILGGWWAHGFRVSTQPHDPYDGWSLTKGLRFLPNEWIRNRLDNRIRTEDRNRQMLIEGVTEKPRLDFDNLKVANGYAFAIIQRAGITRSDMIDMRFTA